MYSISPLFIADLTTLSSQEIQRIDEVAAKVTELGEVHLIKQKGKLAYIKWVSEEFPEDNTHSCR